MEKSTQEQIDKVHKTAKKQGVLLSSLSFLPKKKETPAFGKKGALIVGSVQSRTHY